MRRGGHNRQNGVISALTSRHSTKANIHYLFDRRRYFLVFATLTAPIVTVYQI
jgi:hypothetical protein